MHMDKALQSLGLPVSACACALVDASKCVVGDVGASSDEPEVRYEKHISGYTNKSGIRTGSAIVRKHGFKRNGLRPKQYKHLNPVYAPNFKEVVKKEVELAEKLRKRKHFVYQK